MYRQIFLWRTFLGTKSFELMTLIFFKGAPQDGFGANPWLGYLEKSEVSGNHIRKPGFRQTMVSFSSLLSVIMKFYLSPLLLFQIQGLAAFWKLQLFPAPPPYPPYVLALGTGDECCSRRGIVVTFTDHFRWEILSSFLGQDIVRSNSGEIHHQTLLPSTRTKQNLFFFFF